MTDFWVGLLFMQRRPSCSNCCSFRIIDTLLLLWFVGALIRSLSLLLLLLFLFYSFFHWPTHQSICNKNFEIRHFYRSDNNIKQCCWQNPLFLPTKPPTLSIFKSLDDEKIKLLERRKNLLRIRDFSLAKKKEKNWYIREREGGRKGKGWCYWCW